MSFQLCEEGAGCGRRRRNMMMKVEVSLFLFSLWLQLGDGGLDQATKKQSIRIIPSQKPTINTRDEVLCNILDYGAIEGDEDNALVNQKAITDAITDCGKNSGSRLLIPPGDFVTAPIYFTFSDMTIHLVAGASLIASDKVEYYRSGKHFTNVFVPSLESFSKSSNWSTMSVRSDNHAINGGGGGGFSEGGFESVINFVNVQNVRVEGLGSVDGRGLKW